MNTRSNKKAPEVVSRTTIADEAKALVFGDRAAQYGDKLTNFTQMAMLFTGVLAHKLNAPISPNEAALIMNQLKVSRLVKNPLARDSLVDIAGYALCNEKITEDMQMEFAGEPHVAVNYSNVMCEYNAQFEHATQV